MATSEDKHWDAIVIGSGIGGMAAAAALSKLGHVNRHAILTP